MDSIEAKLLAGASVVFMLFTGVTAAQVAPVAQTQQGGAAASPQEGAPSAEELQQITVTGTRVAGFQPPTSTTTVGLQDLNLEAPTNIADEINNNLPEFSVGIAPTTGTVGTSGGTGGLNVLNLLNLGVTRVLVLEDGQRVVGTNPSGEVNINLIPQQLIQRVDVVTGGGSAVYGSDSVSGVVNFVLNTEFTGFLYDYQHGWATEGGDVSNKIALTYGTSLADGRAHFVISGEWSDQGQAGDFASRSWFNSTMPYQNPVPGALPGVIIGPGVNLNVATAGGLIVKSPANGTLAGTAFGPGGAVSQFNFGTNTGTADISTGGTPNSLAGLEALTATVNDRDIYTRFSFDVAPDVTPYAEFAFGESDTFTPSAYPFYLGTVPISVNNAYLPASIKTQMAAQGLTSLSLGTWNGDNGPIDTVNNYDTYRAVVGINAKLAGTWKLHAYYQYGRTAGYNGAENELNKANYLQAVNSVLNSSGQPVCANPANGCQPLDVLGTGVESSAAKAFTGGTAYRDQINEQEVGSMYAEGQPFSTWAAPVSVVLGGEARRETAYGSVDALSATSGWFSGNFKATYGAYDVREGFFETVIPLARNLPFAKTIDLNGAVRATDYSTSGYVTTWKAAGSWAVSDDLLFRVNRSQDIRAPNLNDLFSVSQFTQTVTDPFHGGASDTIAYTTGGNPNLKPEVAANMDYGVVFTPSLLTGFQASLDYYLIDIQGYITTLASSAQAAVNDCYAGLTQFCPLITRDSSGAITVVNLGEVNIGHLRTSGENIEASYRIDLSGLAPSLGTLGVRALTTHLDNYYLNNSIIAGGLNTAINAGADFPRWKGSIEGIYQKGAFTFGLVGRYIADNIMTNAYAGNLLSNYDVANVFYLDGSVAYKMPFGIELYAVSNNLFNRAPPADGALSSLAFLDVGTSAGLYDTIGRTVRIGIRGKF